MRFPAQGSIELRASDPAPGRTLAAAQALGAEDRGSFAQRQVFFSLPDGRLELIEHNDRAELVEYQAPRRIGAAFSRVHGRLAIDDPAATRSLLAAELGPPAVLESRRRVLSTRNVRIYLDRVRGLGSFVELEALATPTSSTSRQLARLRAWRRRLRIADEDLVEGAYAHLLPADPEQLGGCPPGAPH